MFHFDNLITQLQLGIENRTEIQCLKEISFFPNFKGFAATWGGGYRKKDEKKKKKKAHHWHPRSLKAQRESYF